MYEMVTKTKLKLFANDFGQNNICIFVYLRAFIIPESESQTHTHTFLVL